MSEPSTWLASESHADATDADASVPANYPHQELHRDYVTQFGVRHFDRRMRVHRLKIAHWWTISVSVHLKRLLTRHHLRVGDLGWVADAPEVPSGHRLLSLDSWMSTLRSAGLGGYPGCGDRRQG